MQSIAPIDYVRNAYWNKLEEDGVNIADSFDIGEGYKENRIKDKYADASIEEMTDYLQLPPDIAFVVETACKFWDTQKKREFATNQSVIELFDMVYQWGRVGLVTSHKAPAFLSQLLKVVMEVA